MRLTDEQRQLIEDNMGIAYYMAHKYKYNEVLDFQELLSVAFENLALAALNYQSIRGAQFHTYAFRFIKYKILNEIYKRREQYVVQQVLFHSFIDISDIINNDLSPEAENKLQLITESLREFNGSQREKAAVITFVRNPYLTQAEIARKTGVCQKTVSTAIKNFRQQLQEAV